MKPVEASQNLTLMALFLFRRCLNFFSFCWEYSNLFYIYIVETMNDKQDTYILYTLETKTFYFFNFWREYSIFRYSVLLFLIRIILKNYLQAANTSNVFSICPDWVCIFIMTSESSILGPLKQFWNFNISPIVAIFVDASKIK